MELEDCKQIWNVLILLLDQNTSWDKHMKNILSDQTGFLSGQNLMVPGQTNDVLTAKKYFQACISFLKLRNHFI